MTQSTSPDDPGKRPYPGPRPWGRVGRVVLLVLVVAAAAFAVYRLTFAPMSGNVRAQEPSLHDTAAFYTVEGARITVPPTSPLRAKLVIAPVADEAIARSLVLPAVVEADPAHTVKVLPPVAGRVTELKVQLGERVKAGDVLAVIDSSDLGQAFADDEKARSTLKLTKQTLDRLLSLERGSAISIKDREQAQSDYAQAQAEFERAESRLRTIGVPPDQKQSRQLSLKAPLTGSIIDLQLAQGAVLNDLTAAVMTIADLDTVWVTANVAEKDTALVARDQAVDVVFTAYPSEVFKGKVLFVSDILDADTRRTKVRIAFANPEVRLKPNMFATATFRAPPRSLPVVPTTALMLRNETDQVFVEVAPFVFEARAVDVAFQQGDNAVVDRGLRAGERVVVSGGVLLND